MKNENHQKRLWFRQCQLNSLSNLRSFIRIVGAILKEFRRGEEVIYYVVKNTSFLQKREPLKISYFVPNLPIKKHLQGNHGDCLDSAQWDASKPLSMDFEDRLVQNF
jgi:hypothetical protein